MKSYIKLLRLPNAVMVGLTIFLMRYGVVAPILSVYSMELKLSTLAFLAYTIATMLITAAGYVINDYYDRDLDLINRKKEDVIVGEKIPVKNVLTLYRFLNIVTLILAAYASYESGLFILFICYPIMIGLLYFYSTTYKKQLIIGNLIVSIATAGVPFSVFLFEMPPVISFYKNYIVAGSLNMYIVLGWILGFSLFALISNLVREIIKDMEDFEGDVMGGRNTIPIMWGMKWAKGISVSLLSIIVISIVLIFLAFFTYNGKPDFITLSYLTAFLIIPLFVNIYHIIKGKNTADYKFSGDLLKIIMLLGILFSLVVWYVIKTNLV